MRTGPVSAFVAGVALTALGFVLAGQLRPSGEEALAQVADVADPASELAAILESGDALARARGLVTFLDNLEPTSANAEALRAVLARRRNSTEELAWTLVPAWWARSNPEQALNRRLSAPRRGRWPWVSSVVREWAHRDPGAALAAVSRLSLPEEYQQAAHVPLIRGWFARADADPTNLIDLLEAVEGVRPRGDLITLFLERMIETRGLDATQSFVESMPERSHGFRRELRGRYVEALVSRGDTARAIAWTEAHHEPGDNASLYLAARWGWVDGPGAMRWALALPSGLDREELIERAYRSFLRRDGEAAQAWIRDQEPGPALEPAYTLFLMSRAQEDPEQVLASLEHLEDAARRKQVLTAAGRAWMEQDPTSAKTWLEGADLPAPLVRAILGAPQGGSKQPMRQGVRRASRGAVDLRPREAAVE